MEQTKAKTAEESLMTIEECRATVAKSQGLESWYALMYSHRAFNSKQWVTTMSDKAAELYASQFKSCISNLEEQNEELRSDLHDTRSILGLVDPLRVNLEAQNKELREALEEISEVTVICGNFQEAFDIVQNLVSHTINGTER